MAAKKIDVVGLAAAPWKNGGGVTREIACAPAGAGMNDFAWRLSIADVAASGPFSAFPGVDRVIMLLDGDGMRLEFEDGAVHELRTPFAPYRFGGERALHARLAGAPSRDFNLMLRRGRAAGEIRVWRENARLPDSAGIVCLLAACGSWEIRGSGEGQMLQAGQALVGEHAPGEIALRPVQDDSVLVGVVIHTP